MNINQSGRSMVEMIGVLAIIGVLSVGAIAGYSNAMFKYKQNKQTQQINTIISTLVRYKNDLKINPHNGSGTKDYMLVPMLKKLGEIPQEMYIKNNESYIKDAFNIRYMTSHRTYGGTNISSMFLRSNNLGLNNYSFDICKNLYLIAKEWHHELHSIKIVSYAGTNYNEDGIIYGDTQCLSSRKCLKDLKLTDLDTLCRILDENRTTYEITIVVMYE